MFTYLLIMFELAILFLAYWLVYMQKPSTYRVEEDVWGSYPGAHLRPSESMRLTFSDQYPTGIKSEKIRM